MQESFERKIESLGEHAERVMSFVMLSTIDNKWKDHLYDLDHLKASIGFRGWGQKDPLVEYKKEAYQMFVELMDDIRRTLTQQFFRVRLEQRPAMSFQPQRRLSYSGPSETAGSGIPTRAGGRAGSGTRRAAAAQAQQVDSMGMAASASGGSAAGAMGQTADVRRLATNRGEARPKTPVTGGKAPGRNAPCPCGSGKKYKKCCGTLG